jgi:cell division protein FtsQ
MDGRGRIMREIKDEPRGWFSPKPAAVSASKKRTARGVPTVPVVRTPGMIERIGYLIGRRKLMPITGFVVLIAAGGLAYSPIGAQLGQDLSRIGLGSVEKLSTSAGFQLESVVVTGRVRTNKELVLSAIGIARGGPILSVDPAAVRERLESLDWIDHAQVRRILPGRIEVEIHESIPFAVWQTDGRFTLIDAKGRRITETNVEAFAHLPLVVGNGAADKAAQLFEMLETEPTLKNRVQAAVRVGDRRWNIRFDNGVDLMLPESGFAEAWHKFAAMESESRVLARAISHVDMRLKDKVVVRLTDEGTKAMRVPGRST